MIEINLLPEERRPVERTPLPRFLIILAGVLGFCIEGVVLALILYDWRPKQDILAIHQGRINAAQETIGKINKLKAEIADFKERTVGIDLLYRARRAWAPILYRLSDEPEVLPPGVWFRKLELKKGKVGKSGQPPGDILRITGYARDPSGRNDSAEMFSAMTEFGKNLKTFSDEFEEQVIYADPAVVKDLPGSATPAADMPKKAVSFTFELMLKSKSAATPPRR